MNRPIVQFNNFQIQRAGVPIFQPINLEAFPGDLISVVGANGAGKTTLLNFMSGMIQTEDSALGECLIFSSNFPKSSFNRAKTGLMLIRQFSTCYSSLTVLDQLKMASMASYSIFNPILWGKKNERFLNKIAYQALREMHLQDYLHAPVSDLSVGQLRALSLASAWVRIKTDKLKLLLLDEPTSGLDQKRISDFIQLLNQLKIEGCTIFVAEHLSDDTQSLSKKVLSLEPYGA